MNGGIYSNSGLAPELISAAVKQILASAKALGLTWSLRIATISVLQSVGSNEPPLVAGIYDGDSAAIGLTNITGEELLPGQRVYCLMVPPSGNFIIGFVGIPTPPFSTFGVAAPNGNIAQSTGGVETAVSLANWTTEPVARIRKNKIARITVMLNSFVNTATDSVFIVRVRLGSVTTTGTILAGWRVDANTASTTVQSGTFIGYCSNTSNGTSAATLSLSVLNNTGAATVGLYADATLPLVVGVEEICTTDDNPILAAICQSVA